MFDPQGQYYHVDFKFGLPFSPAALSHIQELVIRVDVLLRLEVGANDTAVILPGLHMAFINVSIFLAGH